MAPLIIKGMRLVRAGDGLPAHVRIKARISAADFVVIDEEQNVLSDARPTREAAAADLFELAEVPTQGGMPILPLSTAYHYADPCFVQCADGGLFLHDPERPDRLSAMA